MKLRQLWRPRKKAVAFLNCAHVLLLARTVSSKAERRSPLSGHNQLFGRRLPRYVRGSDAVWQVSHSPIFVRLSEQETRRDARSAAQRIHQVYPIERGPDANRGRWILFHHQRYPRAGLEETWNRGTRSVIAFAFNKTRPARSGTAFPSQRKRLSVSQRARRMMIRASSRHV